MLDKIYFRQKNEIVMTLQEKNTPEESPPIFKTWNQLYAFVLILHAIIISLFYFFTENYS